MEQYQNMKRDQLLLVVAEQEKKIQELLSTEVGVAIAERDKALDQNKELSETLEKERKDHAGDLKAMNKRLDEQAASDDDRNELQRQVKDLEVLLDAALTTKGDKRRTVVIDGEAHLIAAHRANHGGRIITAEDIEKDVDLAKELKAAGSGLLIPMKVIKERHRKAEEQKAPAKK